MNGTAPVSAQIRAAEAFALLARWFLGAMFLYMGLNKALHPVEFLKLGRRYYLHHKQVLFTWVATNLPGFEV